MPKSSGVVQALLVGGLGNALFGIAAGASIGSTKRGLLVLNTYHLPQGGAELAGLSYPPGTKVVSSRLLAHLHGLNAISTAGVLERIGRHSLVPLTLRGYYQDWRLPRAATSYLKGLLSFPASPSSAFLNHLNDLADARPWIAVHVRRGDYEGLTHIYELLGSSYYQEGIAYCRSRLPSARVVVFCEYPGDAIHSGVNADLVISADSGMSDYENIYLMRSADGIVMANSTFSWWGAWAPWCSRPVVAPTKWYTRPEMDAKALLDPDWVAF